MYCDSQSVIHLTKNQMYHERTNHIDVRLYLIRDVVSEGAILVKKIVIAENPTNMMTKPIPTVKFKHYLELIGFGST